MTGGRDELVERLGRMGLEIAGPWGTDDVPPPRTGWRLLSSGEVEPAVVVHGAGADTAWLRLARECGLLDGDGVFLVDLDREAPTCGPHGWTRVRLTDDWNPGGVPEFVAMREGGDTVLAVISHPNETKITVVDRVAERIEAVAEKSAREQEADWQSLFEGFDGFEGFEGFETSRRLRRLWAEGLALNEAAPHDVPAGLLELTHAMLYRPLATTSVDAFIDHAEWQVRGHLAEVQPDLTPDQWARLIVAEEEPRHRRSLVGVAAYRRAGLPASVCERLVTDPSAQVREELARLPGLPMALLAVLTEDATASVRVAACHAAWPGLDEAARARLLDDPDGTVRTAALLLHHQDHPMPRALFDTLHGNVMETCRLERDLAEQLARAEDPARRRKLALSPYLDPDLVLLLAEDSDDEVRNLAAVHPGLTEEQRARVRFTFDPHTMDHALDWVVALHDDPDAMRRLAASSHPRVRRSVARARRLPPDVVERLARDEDRVVHLFLAESCDDAPAEMLLSVWQWWTGSFSAPDRPHGHPNFPRRDLLRYADHPSPRMRRLALDDPGSTAELVERFSRDGHWEPRYRAATDPRLSAASAVRLLDDPETRVRLAAIRHPRLPARVLIELLRDPETAQDAARHPNLPVPVMRRMLQHVHERGVL